jgi:hypothetical protein
MFRSSGATRPTPALDVAAPAAAGADQTAHITDVVGNGHHSA